MLTPDLPYVGLEHVEAHTMRLLGTVPAGDMKSAAVHFQAGDVLYGRLRPYLNKVLRPKFEGLCSSEFIVLPDSAEFDGGYLQYFLNSAAFVGFASHLKAGDRPRIDFEQIGEFQIPMAPLGEQRRIVAAIEEYLSRLDATVRGLKRVQALISRYRAAVLKAACEGRLVESEAAIASRTGCEYETGEDFIKRLNGAVGSKCPDAGRDLPPLPVGWAWVKLPFLGKLDRGRSKHRPRDDPRLYGGPYPFVQTGDVKRSRGLVRSYSQTYSEPGLAQSRLWPAGTLCVTIAANIADTGILTMPACFPDSVVGFVHAGDPVTVRFVEYFLRTAKANLDRFAPATAQKNINLRILREVAIPVPPLAQQRRIVEEADRRLSLADALERQMEVSLARNAMLRRSVLKNAFEGKLVPQDPRDEAASVLLERICAIRLSTADRRKKVRRRA